MKNQQKRNIGAREFFAIFAPFFKKHKAMAFHCQKDFSVLENVKNFRDLGGLRTIDGRYVKYGLFLRSGHLANLTMRDIETLHSSQLNTIIDLRTPEECKDEPDPVISGIAYRPIPIFKESILGITHELKGKSFREIQQTFSKERIRSLIPDMPELYKSMITNKDALDQVAAIMHQIIENTYSGKSTLIHCTVGKDRTGVVSALLLALLGVDEETIAADYLRSNAAIRIRAWMIYGLIAVFKLNFEVAREFRNAYMAKKENIMAVFEAIQQNFGCIRNFMYEGLQIREQEYERFKNLALNVI